MPMKKYKIAVLDDYQNVALESADWSVLRERATSPYFITNVADPDAVIERLLPLMSFVSCASGPRCPEHHGAPSHLKLLPRRDCKRVVDIARGRSGIAVVYTGQRVRSRMTQTTSKAATAQSRRPDRRRGYEIRRCPLAREAPTKSALSSATFW